MKQNPIVKEVFDKELKQIEKGKIPEISNNKVIDLLTKMKEDKDGRTTNKTGIL